MDIEKVNSMDFREFVDVFGNVIERCPLIAAAVWSQRPFSNLEDLEKHFFAFIDALPLSVSTKYWPYSSCCPTHPRVSAPAVCTRLPHRGLPLPPPVITRLFPTSVSLLFLEKPIPWLLQEVFRPLCPALFDIKAPLRAKDFEKIRNAQAPYRVPAPSRELSTAMDEVKKIGRLRLADLLGSDFPKP
uniref:2-oxo-4-hydroxy-4-carboxy-5-ureidoimidazoline decarboxylase n=1 Tax=Camelus bactrianus TaxID=9837 RepID=A0A9W3HFJ5_CAMBA|nr:putative 2-oxo-4-hydroxy-4-carboxy-5-ureidoimidazoline decarboxylase [Camelus bactrianus]